MQMLIPDVGDYFELTEDWMFFLHPEYRNKDLWNYLGFGDMGTQKDPAKPVQVVLESGTVLVCDRVYIRKDMKEYSSLTFRIMKESTKGRFDKNYRFWAKLEDVNDGMYVARRQFKEVKVRRGNLIREDDFGKYVVYRGDVFRPQYNANFPDDIFAPYVPLGKAEKSMESKMPVGEKFSIPTNYFGHSSRYVTGPDDYDGVRVFIFLRDTKGEFKDERWFNHGRVKKDEPVPDNEFPYQKLKRSWF